MPMTVPSLEPVLPGIRTVTVVRRPCGKGEMAVPHPRINEAASVSRGSWCPRIPKGDSGLTDEGCSNGSFARQRRRGRAGPVGRVARPDAWSGHNNWPLGRRSGAEGGT